MLIFFLTCIKIFGIIRITFLLLKLPLIFILIYLFLLDFLKCLGSAFFLFIFKFFSQTFIYILKRIFLKIIFFLSNFFPLSDYWLIYRSSFIKKSRLSLSYLKCPVIFIILLAYSCLSAHYFITIKVLRFIPLTLFSESAVIIYFSCVFIIC
jgi:hypothetical protein